MYMKPGLCCMFLLSLEVAQPRVCHNPHRLQGLFWLPLLDFYFTAQTCQNTTRTVQVEIQLRNVQIHNSPIEKIF